MKPKYVCIIGLGLIGGSLAKSIKRKYSNCFIMGIDTNQANLDAALAEGTIHMAMKNVGQDIRKAELIFICTPVESIPCILSQIAPLISSETIITDTGSTKQEIIEAAQKFWDSKLILLEAIQWQALIILVITLLSPIYLRMLTMY